MIPKSEYRFRKRSCGSKMFVLSADDFTTGNLVHKGTPATLDGC